MPVPQRMTAEDFIAAPEQQRGWPVNLVDGEVVVNDPTVLHNATVKAILLEFTSWTRSAQGRGEAMIPHDVRMDEHNVFKPDVLWYAQGRAPALADSPPYPLPDIAVEVRSPSTWRYDVGRKKSVYESSGLRELWLADTASATVLVFRRSRRDAPLFDVALELSGSDRLESPQLPAFALAVAEVFPASRDTAR